MTQAPAFTFASGNLRKILAAPRYLVGWLRALNHRRDPGLWVVGSAFGVADGALAFARAVRELADPPRLVWLARTAQEAEDARRAGFAEVVERDSPEGLDVTIEAGLAAVTHGFGDVNRYGLTGAVVVQLWHGAPLKRLHADSPAVVAAGTLGRLPGVGGLTRWAYRRATSRISLLPVGSELVQPFMASAFHLTTDEVRVLGEPRADVLFVGEPAAREAAARALLERHLGGLGGRRVLLWAPTWRDGKPDPGIPTAAEWELIDEFCARHDVVLVIRPHPLCVGSYTYSSAHVRLLSPTVQVESMPLLWGVDLLVTDYSSILVDYAVTGRPILLLAPDLDEYVGSRGLYLDYADLAGGAWSTTWPDLLAALGTVLTDPDALAAARAHSASLAARFHSHTDGRNAARVAAAAAALVRPVNGDGSY